MTPESPTQDDARLALRAALESGDVRAARRTAQVLLGKHPQAAAASFIRRSVDKGAIDRLALAPLRVALLSSFSIELIHDVLIAFGFVEGLRIQLYQAGFDQFRQDILNADSGLYAFSPDVVVLAVEGRDLVPELYAHDVADGVADLGAAVAEAGRDLALLVQAFRERSAATLLVHNFAMPTWRRLGILDGQPCPGQAESVSSLNTLLAGVCRQARSVYMVDYASLVQRLGALSWYDERMAQYARAPIAQGGLAQLAFEYMKFFRALAGKTKKCLVLDLDNTLWGGVLGEDGPRGIHLGPEYPGSAYLAFQRAIRGLRQRGVVLAVASKNNPSDVDEVFATHPQMALRREDFSILRVGWNAKSQSIAEIAAHLNIALDHVVFVDDSPAECDEVAHALPAVTIVTLPNRPEHFVRALLESGYFDSLTTSAEDARRTELYQQRDQAEVLRGESASVEDFYRRLEMEVIFSPVHDGSVARAAQLTHKTNQFNVTSIRYAEEDLLRRSADPAWLVTTVQVRDRFGDNGVVGFMMANQSGAALEIDTLLLSCRVIGRTVETAMLARLCEHAAERGLQCVRGRLVVTAKNAPARDLYERHGFRRDPAGQAGESSWELDLGSSTIKYPEWIRIVSEASAHQRNHRQLVP